MISVSLYRDVNEIMEVVRALRQHGLVQGTHFDFAYCPPKYDNDGWQPIHAKHTVFTFYEEKWATWFALKYSNGHSL